jgi:16S rRNA G966 N2-methylase RsmD
MLEIKKYTRAPLPFNGQKNKWRKDFSRIIEQTNHSIYVDMFGGSGLLSHTIKTIKPGATVIYNDFDNYSERLRNIDKTNALLSDLRKIVQGLPDDVRILGDKREQIINRVEKETGYIDWDTLSVSVLFTMKTVNNIESLRKTALYNEVPKNAYNADGYLVGVETIHMDYMDAFERYKNRDALFILDPPYLCTDNLKYKNVKYWTLSNYLSTLIPLKNSDFIYFSSGKSQIEELFLFIQKEYQVITPFTDVKKIERKATNGGTINYPEYLYYKYQHNTISVGDSYLKTELREGKT